MYPSSSCSQTDLTPTRSKHTASFPSERKPGRLAGTSVCVCVCIVFVALCFSGTGCLEVHSICFNRRMKVIHICLNLYIFQSDLWNVYRISQTLQSASDMLSNIDSSKHFCCYCMYCHNSAMTTTPTTLYTQNE